MTGAPAVGYTLIMADGAADGGGAEGWRRRVGGRRFFFIHVMKTAGTTFVRQLQQQFPAEAIYPARDLDWTSPADVDAYINIPRLLAVPAERRAQIRVFTGHFPYMVCDQLDPALVTMTVLRDPIERTISILKQHKRSEERFRDLPLEAVYDDRPIFRFFVENHQTKVFALAPDDNEVAINCGMTIDDARYARAKENLARVARDRSHRGLRRLHRRGPRALRMVARRPRSLAALQRQHRRLGGRRRRSAPASRPTTRTTSRSTNTPASSSVGGEQ